MEEQCFKGVLAAYMGTNLMNGQVTECGEAYNEK